MARPAKSARVKTGTITKEEEAQRLELEDKLRGKNDKLVPPLYLTESQMEIFNYIMAELQEADILGNLDLFILAQTLLLTVSRSWIGRPTIRRNCSLRIPSGWQGPRHQRNTSGAAMSCAYPLRAGRSCLLRK